LGGIMNDGKDRISLGGADHRKFHWDITGCKHTLSGMGTKNAIRHFEALRAVQ
jgi:hypothetical protein